MQNILENIGINSDQTIIEKILAGDNSLFEILIRRHNPVLYKIARGYGFNHQDAEDIMQDVHVTAYTNLPKFENRASYKTWISRIAVNRCLYKLKYGYHKNEMPVEQVHEPVQPGSMNNQPEEKMINRELAVVLENSLEKLPLIYRTVFILREMEGFSVAETAELLGITPVNVKVRLKRARVLLQQKIEQVYNHQDIYSFNLIYCNAIVHHVYSRINSLKD
jgi:RNA polymerase sigma factor (sigma-70 family)